MTSTRLFLPRGLLASLSTAAFLSACAINPRPAFNETSALVKSRTGLEATWMRSEAEEEVVLARVRDILKEPLSPRRAAQIALINNRGLQARLEELGIAQAHLAAAAFPGNPEIEGFLGWPSGNASSKKVDLGFGLDVLDLLVLPSRRRLAALELKQAKAMAGDEILHMAARAQTDAYSLQALESQVRAVSTAFEIEEALAGFADVRRAAGTLSDLAYEEERARLDGLRMKRSLMELDLIKKREAVNQTLGLAGDLTTWTMEPLASELPVADPSETGLEKAAIDQRFDLEAARAAVDLLEGTLRLQKKTRYLPAGVRVGAQTEKEGTARVSGPTVRLQLPIFNPGRAEASRVEALYFQAQRLVEDRAIKARAEVREKRSQLVGSREIVRRHEETVAPRKKRIVDLTQGYYNMMLKGADDLLRAKRDEIEAEVPLIEALRSYWVARTELALALGGSIPAANEGEKR